MIKTNYEYQNWVELVVFLAIFFTIVIVPVVLYIEIVFTPILDAHLDFLQFINNDGLIERYGEHLNEQIVDEQLTIDEFSLATLSLILLVLGPLFLVFPVIIIIRYSIGFSYWVCKKVHILPMLQLVIIRKNKGKTILRFKQ